MYIRRSFVFLIAVLLTFGLTNPAAAGLKGLVKGGLMGYAVGAIAKQSASACMTNPSCEAKALSVAAKFGIKSIEACLRHPSCTSAMLAITTTAANIGTKLRDVHQSTEKTDNTPKNCPPASTTNESMSERAARYQQQITGLPLGAVILINGVKFDGCRESDGTLLDAKGPGYQQFFKDGDFVEWAKAGPGLMVQAQRQIIAADGRRIEWYVAEAPVALALQVKFAIPPINNRIVVKYSPAE